MTNVLLLLILLTLLGVDLGGMLGIAAGFFTLALPFLIAIVVLVLAVRWFRWLDAAWDMHNAAHPRSYLARLDRMVGPAIVLLILIGMSMELHLVFGAAVLLIGSAVMVVLFRGRAPVRLPRQPHQGRSLPLA